MARIRSIKPDFWTDEKIVELSPFARLLFIGLWNFADDEGRMVCSPKKIKMQVFPADSLDISELLGEIRGEGLIDIYVVDNIEYLQVHGFSKHQKIDKRTKSKLPENTNPSDSLRIPTTDMDQGRDKERIVKKETKVSKKRKRGVAITLEEWEDKNGPLNSEQFIEWGKQNGYQNIPFMLEKFKSSVRAKGYTYINFPEAFRSWDWKDYRTSPVTLFSRTPMPSPAGG